MSRGVSLHEHGVRLFACRLYNHDYLWFSSYEISRVSTSLPVLHNYALTFSLGDFSWGICRGSAPNYEGDLDRIPLYATPALASSWSKTRITYNAVSSRSWRTDDAPRGINSPDIGYRIYIDPAYAAADGPARGPGFACYLFTFTGQQPKGITRLGKKGAAIRIHWAEVLSPAAVYCTDPVTPTHPLNPLDVGGRVLSYEPVSVPPHLLLRVAEVCDDWFVFAGPHRVHVPKRVLQKCRV